MAKTFKLRRTGRSAMKYRKKRTTRLLSRSPYVAKEGLNVSPSTRYFAPLPYKMDMRTDWLADTRWECGLGGGTDRQIRTESYYLFIDALNMTQYVSTAASLSTAGRKFWSADLGAMLALYQEAIFRTHVLNAEITADYSRAVDNGTSQQIIDTSCDPSLHVAVAQVPLSYLRKEDNSLHTLANAGTLYSGVDYYSALTQTPGAKSGIVGYGASPTVFKTRTVIDGYAHNGVQQSITSSMTWDAGTQLSPQITYSYPNPGQRNVFLFAFRFRYIPLAGVTQQLSIRAALKLEQHLVLQDKYPAFPYILGAGLAS